MVISILRALAQIKADVTGLPVNSLSAMVGFHLTIFSLIVPFWLVAAQAGWRAMIEVWPACLVCGVSFGAVPSGRGAVGW